MPQNRFDRYSLNFRLIAPGVAFSLIGVTAGLLALYYRHVGLALMELLVGAAFAVLCFVRRPILLQVRQFALSTTMAFKILVALAIGCALFIR